MTVTPSAQATRAISEHRGMMAVRSMSRGTSYEGSSLSAGRGPGT